LSAVVASAASTLSISASGKRDTKTLFCGDAEPLFDSYLALRPAGHLLAPVLAMGASAKRAIKQHPVLWALASTTRHMIARFPAAV